MSQAVLARQLPTIWVTMSAVTFCPFGTKTASLANSWSSRPSSGPTISKRRAAAAASSARSWACLAQAVNHLVNSRTSSQPFASFGAAHSIGSPVASTAL